MSCFAKKAFRLLMLAAVLPFIESAAQSIDSSLYSMLRWRMIGPHRGGRTVGAVGVPQQPNIFYIGVNNGGVWKTTDYGRTWLPIFDDQPTGSIGDIVVSPSNPNVIYVGSGEGLQRPDLSVGDGIYRSVDGGKTWSNTGLKDAQQIGGMDIDPANENRVFVAALGHPYGPNTERGVYRTTDGGKTWERVLYKDENTGAIQVTIDPKNSNTVYAALWAGRQGPWENGAWNGPESGLFKSTDGGNTWNKLTNGLPTTQQGLSRIGFGIAPSDPNRIYASVDAGNLSGIYRSDDAGANWRRIQTDGRLFGRGTDFAEIKVDPKNADIVYSGNIATWKSFDGGMTWKEFRGAPGGDDYHRIWINPNNPDIILLASDQGAIITVNGGQTFSSWYNQPTSQFYHVSTDNAFPYNVYGGQQESGSVGISSRGNDGQITFREWHPVGVEEYGYVAADPLDPNIIYGGKITRFDKRTGQTQNIAPEAVRSGKYRFLRTAPVLFSPVDNKTLFFAGNVLFKTMDGGNNWQVISPDLSRETWDVPSSVGVYTSPEMKTMPRRGVIYTVAPSYKDINTIWCGTDDGLIHITRDGGKTWKNVTPPEITSWSKISMIEASHTDVNTAYAAVNRIRMDDMRPHIYKTSDGGKTWTKIVNGLPDDPVNAVREDHVVKGILYAGSERAVHVSFNDGRNWLPLRLNMPATSIRDLVIKDNDIVAGTHGRSFWILDDISALRSLHFQHMAMDSRSINTLTMLHKPAITYRVRWNMNTDTPIPQEEPSGENPPDGAVIDYYLPIKDFNEPTDLSEVRLEITDAKGNLVRKFSSKDTMYKIPPVNYPSYWLRQQQILSAKRGAHRFVWDLHYEPLNLPPSFPIAAIYKNTAPRYNSPWIMPGEYTVKLTVGKEVHTKRLTVKMDPRVKTSIADLQLQHDLSLQAYNARKEVLAMMNTVLKSKERVQQKLRDSPGNSAQLIELDKKMTMLHSTPATSADISLTRLTTAFASLHDILQDSDRPPTTQVKSALKEALAGLTKLKLQWEILYKEIQK